MHASLEQLLSVLDGELPARDACGCEACVQALEQLKLRRLALRSLPAVAPPGNSWQRLSLAMRAAPEPAAQVDKRWSRMAASLGALAALLMTASWLQGGAGQRLADAGQPPEKVARLVHESRALEDLLAALEQRSPSVMNAARADLIASLEDRIALVDYGLSHPEHMNLSSAESTRLWEERVNLMATLVEAHGVPFQPVDF